MADVKREHRQVVGMDGDGIKKKDYKLLVDPQIKKGEEKLIRYDGTSYNTDNHGQGMVVMRDPRPRMNRLWSRRERAELPVPRYKVDDWYVGAVPPREVTFSRLNDNITKQFMEKMCSKFGKLERVRVYHHPKTQKHMGLSKVVFSSIKSAAECVKNLHMTSIMGNVIHAQIDCKGELLNKLYQRIVKGEIMAETIPDVIRHTQDGITMSNKYKEHNHHNAQKKERRKSSQDDPRKLRRSIEGRPKSTAHGGHVHSQKDSVTAPPQEMDHETELRKDPEAESRTKDFTEEPPQNSTHKSIQRQSSGEKDESIGFEKEQSRGSIDDDSSKPNKGNRIWSTDLESRINMLLSEQTKKYNLDDAAADGRSDEGEKVSKPNRAQNHSRERTPEKRRSKKEKRKKRHKSHDSAKTNDSESSQNRKVRERLPDRPDESEPMRRSVESPMRDQHRRTISPPQRELLRSPHDHSLPPPARFRPEEPDFDRGYPPRDIGFEHDRRRGMHSSRSPRQLSPPYYERPPHHYDGPHHDRRRYSPPPYGRRSPRHHSPGYERHRRMKRDFPDRGDVHREYSRFPYRDDPGFPHQHPDYHFRRRGSPVRIMRSPHRQRPRSPGRWISPERFPDRVPHPHHQRPISPRMGYYRRSPSRDRSPDFGRRSPGRHRRPVRYSPPPERFGDFDRRDDVDHRKHRLPSPSREPHSMTENNREESDVPGVKRERTPPPKRDSRDLDSPKLTLDQRLKQMTGEEGEAKESVVENTQEQVEIKTEVDIEVSSNGDGSSVDMEISEGESEGEKAARLNSVSGGKNPCMQQMEVVKQEMWQDFNKMPWNGFGPPPDMPPRPDARMWNDPNQSFFKGFPRDARFPYAPMSHFTPERWPEQFHPGMHRPEMPPFHLNMPFRPPFPGDMERMHFNMMSEEDVQKRMEDQELSHNVLGDIVHDLKAIVSRDLNKKVIETMAFKVYESWWDQHDTRKKATNKPPLPSSLSDSTNVVNDSNVPESTPKDSKPVTQSVSKENKNLLNAFDPLNWAKNSFEMDGFRIGLGLRSAISKMPSFRVKKRPRTPTPPPEGSEIADKDVSGSMKKRRVDNKENEENERLKRKSKDKKTHRRITTLGSEGEDEDANSDVESELSSDGGDDDEPKYKVLDVDEIFSESSESDESENESEDSEDNRSENESESDVPQAEKVPSPKEDAKTLTVSSPENKKESLISSEREFPENIPNIPLTPGHDTSMAVSLLSPTAPSITGNVLTPQQLRHVHPKKRHRLISQDQAHYDVTAKVSERLRSDDELSSMSDKEKTALEALTDMQMTPDRRLSSQSSDSLLLPPASGPSSPAKAEKPCPLKSPDKTQDDTRPSEGLGHELEAVAAAALMSIRKSIPPLSPPTPERKPAVQGRSVTPRKRTVPLTSNEDKFQMAELAEEHNYFVPSFSPRHVPASTDPVIAQILEEHNYSRPYLDSGSLQYASHPQASASPTSASTPSAESVFNFEDITGKPEIISAAERVKLRREQSKQRPLKKRARDEHWQHEEKDYLLAARSQVQDLMILYEMWNDGLDLEDMKYLREVYEGYLEKSNSPTWVNDSHWVPHPITNVPDPSSKAQRKRRRGKNKEAKDEIQPHKTGSARTEGYYQLDNKIKLKQRRLMYGRGSEESAGVEKVQNAGHNTELASGAQNSSDLCKNLGSRETRHFMRRIASEVGADVGDMFKYNQLMFRKKAVKFKRSSIHGWGLFAQEAIGADEMVIEYVGQVVRTLIAERREVHYTEIGIGSSYLFRIDSDFIIDATKCGNYARFMNHSCNPSCYAKVITVDTVKKIVIYSKGPIKKGQEITYDYKFPLEDDKIVCFCGAENCRRTLN